MEIAISITFSILSIDTILKLVYAFCVTKRYQHYEMLTVYKQRRNSE